MKPSPERRYGCADYRDEMRLLGLRRRLERGDLPPQERERLAAEVADLERRLGLR